jgi:hypothetical protein
MNITKDRLKQIIKEELDAINEGDEISTILQMLDPETLAAAKVVAQAALKGAPLAAGSVAIGVAAQQLRDAVAYLKKGVHRDEDEDEYQVFPRG